jgi:uncharacterized glyoxalase superfamily protein PhnB
MNVRRIVPNIVSKHPDLCSDFYVDFLGMEVVMDMEWIVTYASPDNPTAQISLVRSKTVVRGYSKLSSETGTQTSFDQSITLSIEVSDVDKVYQLALAKGYTIVYPLTDEPWGVRRFHVADPNGVVINILSHKL